MGEEEKTYLKNPLFPNTEGAPFEITSPEYPAYNCVAWALGRSDTWWEADEGLYWLPDIPADNLLSTLVTLFKKFEFEICSGEKPEEDFEKIALYSNDGENCSHIARLLPDGRWTSKLGESYDVAHSLDSLNGGLYGDALIFMKKPIHLI